MGNGEWGVGRRVVGRWMIFSWLCVIVLYNALHHLVDVPAISIHPWLMYMLVLVHFSGLNHTRSLNVIVSNPRSRK